MFRLVGVWASLVWVTIGCSGSDKDAPRAGGPAAGGDAVGMPSAGRSGAGQDSGGGRAGTVNVGAGAGGADGNSAGMGGGGSAGTGGGSSADDELANVFNLVDANAQAELEAYLIAGEGMPHPLSDPGGLMLGVNGFLDVYLEDYDFVFLMTDHDVTTNTYGKFQTVNYEIMPGTGNDFRGRQAGYKTNGRIKGVAGFKYVPSGFGPFGHELMHYWANRLDPSFGLGVGRDFNSKAHWGYADVHGQLGGFDPSSFHCETPAGASPPACQPTAGGRYRYVTPFFGPNANGVSIPYAPLELYLMGLAPSSEVPDLHVLKDAQFASQDNVAQTLTLEASGIDTVTMDAIVARHGTALELPANQRTWKLAMVVVSATPAPTSVLAEIGHAIAAFGNRASDPDLPSFEALTGGRAKLDTRLGPRRKPSDPPPVAEPVPGCDVLAQDCGVTGSTCVLSGQNGICALAGHGQSGDPCSATGFDCAKGLECIYTKDGTSTYCSPYCDPSHTTSPVYCNDICADHIVLGTPDGKILAGRCRLK